MAKTLGIYDVDLPLLPRLHTGKVRESYRIDDEHRLLVVTDRISCFDKVLQTPIPDKGAVLNSISAFWFRKTEDICPNHFVRLVDPSASVVREAVPLAIEVIVRGYLAGSAWRDYSEGKRVFSGVQLPDGLQQNQAFSEPVLTPTTKEEIDREISPPEMISDGLVTEEQWTVLSDIATRLFERGTKELAPRNLLLVDTKYEFGLLGDRIILIDEIHTPDSSRFWYADSYAADPASVKALDKEFVRQWLLDNPMPDGSLPNSLPQDVLSEARRRYLRIYESITGEELELREDIKPEDRLAKNLREAGIIGSEADEKIEDDS